MVSLFSFFSCLVCKQERTSEEAGAPNLKFQPSHPWVCVGGCGLWSGWDCLSRPHQASSTPDSHAVRTYIHSYVARTDGGHLVHPIGLCYSSGKGKRLLFNPDEKRHGKRRGTLGGGKICKTIGWNRARKVDVGMRPLFSSFFIIYLVIHIGTADRGSESERNHLFQSIFPPPPLVCLCGFDSLVFSSVNFNFGGTRGVLDFFLTPAGKGRQLGCRNLTAFVSRCGGLTKRAMCLTMSTARRRRRHHGLK